MAEKTEKKSGGGQIIKLALVLFAVSAIMALALGLVYEVTKDTIAMRAAETTKNAYANVLQADDYAEQADFENDGTITKLSVATTGGEQTGYVAETTFSGAQGMITMVSVSTATITAPVCTSPSTPRPPASAPRRPTPPTVPGATISSARATALR